MSNEYSRLLKHFGGPKKYYQFRKNRELALQRDNYACVHCGLNEIEIWQKYKRGPDVHHIDENPLNNRVNNLVTLCSSCHQQIHPKRIFWRYVGLDAFFGGDTSR